MGSVTGSSGYADMVLLQNDAGLVQGAPVISVAASVATGIRQTIVMPGTVVPDHVRVSARRPAIRYDSLW